MEQETKRRPGGPSKKLSPETLDKIKDIFGISDWNTCTGQTFVSTDLRKLCDQFNEPEFNEVLIAEVNKHSRPRGDTWSGRSLVSLLQHVLAQFDKSLAVSQRKSDCRIYKIVDL